MNKLKIALQKKGRLHDDSIKLIKDIGIEINNCDNLRDKLRAEAINLPISIFFLRDDDIPKFVQEGIVDIGIVGKNIVLEQKKDILIKEKLDFGICRLSIAVPKDTRYKNVKDLMDLRIATSYPLLLKNFLVERDIDCSIVNMCGSVEIAVDLGIADAICDLVGSGDTLFRNHLKELKQVQSSSAVVLVSPKHDQKPLVKQLLFRIQAVKKAIKNISFYAPNKKLDNICSFFITCRPHIKPTLLKSLMPKCIYVQVVVPDDLIWDVISFLKINGAKYIMVSPIKNRVE